MKVVIFLALLVICIFAEKYTTTTSLNVRDGPCTTFKTIKTLPQGTIVEASGPTQTGCGYDWIHLSTGGYVATKFLTKEQKPSPTPSGDNKIHTLLIGDSHTCGTFGQTLDSKLRGKYGASQVATFGRAGMRVSSFLNGVQTTKWGWIDYLPDGKRLSSMTEKVTPKLQNLLNEYKPKQTIVALGANEIQGGSKDQITSLLTQIKHAHSSCAWVLPPQTRCDSTKCPYSPKQLQAYYALVTPLLKQFSCTIINSDPQTLPFLDFNKLIVQAKMQGDAIHYDSLGSVGRDAAKQWAAHAFNNL